jgi:hypothetical protein
MTDKPKRPPAERGQGRKSVSGAGASPVLRLRVSPALLDKVKSKGSAWAREALESAK